MDRSAIVTGGGTGLGRAIADALASSGVNVIIGGRRVEPLQAVVEELRDRPGSVEATQCNVTLGEDRERLAGLCRERFGSIDILVNNAGISYEAPILDFPEDGWRRVMATNLDAPFFMAIEVLEDMRRAGWGRIINIASVYGSLGFNASLYGDLRPTTSPGDRGPVRAPAYHVSKGGLLNMTRELAIACAEWGVTVNSVSPGMFPVGKGNINEDGQRMLQEMTPMKRFGKPVELAAVVKFIASDDSSFMTGSEVTVDGGWSIW